MSGGSGSRDGQVRQAPVADLQRLLDPRLEWVHDKEIGPARDQTLYNVLGVVWKVISGRVMVRTVRGTWEGGPGDWVFLQPGHRFQAFQEGTRIWSVGYRFNRTRGSSCFIGPDVVVVHGSPRMDTATRRLMGPLEASSGRRPLGWVPLSALPSDLEAWMRVDAAFRMWLAAVVRTVGEAGMTMLPSSYPDERIRAVMAVLSSDPWAAAAEPAELARTVRLSRRRLEQLFAAAIGHGLAEERSSRRLQAACELLLRRDLQVKQIATRCGFPRSSTFSTWFRRHAGVPPQRFRRHAAGGAF